MKIYCLNKECVLADKCLRVQKIDEETDTVIRVVNQGVVAGGAECQYFASGDTVRYGKGFIKMLETLPRKTEDEFRRMMLHHYPRNKYFKMRKGEVLCSPEDQQLISTIITQLSITCDTIFDAWVEKVDW